MGFDIESLYLNLDSGGQSKGSCQNLKYQMGGSELYGSYEDYPDRWLPTLDTKLRVDGSNQILYDFFEKPTSSNLTVQKRTAMGEDSKMQVLSNDLIRRLMNNSEELDQGAKVKIVQGTRKSPAQVLH